MSKYVMEMLSKRYEFLKEKLMIAINFSTTKKKNTMKNPPQKDKRKKQPQSQEKEKDKKSWQRTLFP